MHCCWYPSIRPSLWLCLAERISLNRWSQVPNQFLSKGWRWLPTGLNGLLKYCSGLIASFRMDTVAVFCWGASRSSNMCCLHVNGCMYIYIHTYICMNYCNMYLVDVLWIYSEININAYIYIYLADGFNTPRGWSGSKWTLCLPELHQNHVHCLMSGWLLTATFGRRWSSIIHSGFQKHASRWNANQVISRYVFVLFYL